MTVSVHTDVTIDAYHASEHVSHSNLLTFDGLGALAYKLRHLTGEAPPFVRTAPMNLGNAAEVFIQDPAAFAKTYVEVRDEGEDRKELAERCAALGLVNEDEKSFTARHGVVTMKTAIVVASGGHVVTRKEAMTIEAMARNLEANKAAARVMREFAKQITLRNDLGRIDVIPGLQARPDWALLSGGEVVETVDLKCIAQFDEDSVTRGLIPGHATQAATIDAVLERCVPHRLLLCETTWPYRVTLKLIDPWHMERARAWVDERIDALRTCYDRDEWPLCEDEGTTTPPRWAARNEE